MDWEYFSLSSHTRPELLPYPDGTFELVVMVSIADVILNLDQLSSVEIET